MGVEKVEGPQLGGDSGIGIEALTPEQRQTLIAALDKVVLEAGKLRDRILKAGGVDTGEEEKAREDVYQVLRSLEMGDRQARDMMRRVQWRPGVTVQQLIEEVFKQRRV